MINTNKLREILYSLGDPYYRKEPIGDGNPYYRCISCHKADPEISISGHKKHCEEVARVEDLQAAWNELNKIESLLKSNVKKQ